MQYFVKAGKSWKLELFIDSKAMILLVMEKQVRVYDLFTP